MFYSNEDFTKEMGTKLGVVKQFRKTLHQRGYLKTRELLSDVHVPVYDDVMSFKKNNNSTWEQAMDAMIKVYDEWLRNGTTELVKLDRE